MTAPVSTPAASGTTPLLTFDIEHWYEGFRQRGLGGWEQYPSRDDRPVNQLLDLLAETGQRATLFTTGRFAEEYPAVVRRAAAEGHEIASHSYSHTLLSRLSPAEIRADLRRSFAVLEDLAGQKVLGFRAPKWSVTRQNRAMVLAELADAGLVYDSSEFPPPLGGGRPVAPHRVALADGRSMWEVPATVLPCLGLRLPAAGGLYFRLFPAWFTRAALTAAPRLGAPGMIYLHPYDYDREGPRLRRGSLAFQFGRYYGVAASLGRLTALLRDRRFRTVLDHVRQLADAVPSAPVVTP